MSGTISLQSSPGLSEILGAYDTGHWETVVAQIKPASGVLARGSVLSAVAADGGKLTLCVGGQEATAYGILLDASVDTTILNGSGTVTGSVARAGSFRGAALIVGSGTDEAALAKQLRLLGIFTEGAIAPVALASGAPPEERKATGPAEAPVAIEEKPDHKREHRHVGKS